MHLWGWSKKLILIYSEPMWVYIQQISYSGLELIVFVSFILRPNFKGLGLSGCSGFQAFQAAGFDISRLLAYYLPFHFKPTPGCVTPQGEERGAKNN